MPAVAPLPPAAIRELLESHGYEMVAEDDYNWAFAKGENDEPVMVPNAVDLVPLEVAFHVASKVGFNDYFDKLRVVGDTASDKSIH
jgi:hypothetical protein